MAEPIEQIHGRNIQGQAQGIGSRYRAVEAGIEIGRSIIAETLWRIDQQALRMDQAVVHWESFWRADFSKFDTIIVYGIPYIMRDLQKKLERELRPGTKIISNAFQFPGWKPVATERKIHLYIWGNKSF